VEGSTKPGEDPREQVLRLTYEELRRENERLRDARAAVTRQLGPLPISAALVAGLVAGFAGDGKTNLDKTPVVWALIAFGAMVLISMLYSALKPYRKLREEAQKGRADPRDCPTPAAWYEEMIAIERKVRSGSNEEAGWQARTLQAGFDLEWQGLFLTKLLFVAVVVLLILARID
jgi:hypothetical protein